jgi:hypothetical protein
MPILGRFLAVIALLVVFGLVLRLVLGVLSPILPAPFMADLSSGWGLLYGIMTPAFAPIYALLILVGVCWVALGGRR